MKNINWKLALRTGLWSLLILGFLVSVGFSSSKQDGMLCKGVSVTMLDTNGQTFVEAGDIIEIIKNKFGVLEGKPMGSINISLLEKIMNTNPFVSKTEVFSTIDGKITIEVKQRTPVLRIINFNDESFYIDNEGLFMPLSDKYTARVPVANGYIFDKQTEQRVTKYTGDQAGDSSLHMIDRIFHVADYIQKNEFWRAGVEQLFVNAQGDIELIPRVGFHTVILGDDQQLEEKLNKLLLFYKEGLKLNGWNQYNVINIKFKDQVVCSKN